MSDNSITIGIRDLREAVRRAAAVTERRNTIPILDCLRIRRGSDGCVVVTGTDLDIHVEVVARIARAEGEFDVAVDAAALRALLCSLPGREVTLDASRGRVRVSSGPVVADLMRALADEFPEGVSIEAALITIDGAALRAALTRLMPAVSTEETRYYLNGVFFELRSAPSGSMLMTATDGHKLVTTAVSIAAETSGLLLPAPFILPRKACQLLSDMAGDAPVTMLVSTNGVRAAFLTASGTISTRTIDGTFPEYRRVIPKGPFDRELRVGRGALDQAIGIVSAINSATARSVRLIGGEGAPLMMETRHADLGEIAVKVAASWRGEPLEFGFNAASLRALLAGFPDGTLVCGIGDAGSPMLIRAEGVAEAEAPAPGEFRAVIMPMRV